MLSLNRRITGFAPYATPTGKWSVIVAAMTLMLHWAMILRFLAVRTQGNLNYLKLHYSVLFGLDWIDRWWLIATFPLLGLLAFAANMAFAQRLARTRAALGTLMLVSLVPLELLFATGGAIAILLNS
jgi:hypothetical protein